MKLFKTLLILSIGLVSVEAKEIKALYDCIW